MKKLILMMIVSLFCALYSAVAQEKSFGLIQELTDSWINASNAENVELFMKLVSDDATIFKPGEPTVGTESIRSLYSDYYGAYDLEFTATIKETEIYGNKAYVWCLVEGTLQLKDGGELEKVAYNNMWILKNEDEAWKFWRVMFITAITPE